MRPEQIKVGKTYRNRGKGRTTRKVVSIVPNTEASRFWPRWYIDRPRPPNEPIVLFKQRGQMEYLYLCSFASWAGSEVNVCNGCGNENPEYVKECPYCGSDKCNRCDMGDDVECGNCPEEE